MALDLTQMIAFGRQFSSDQLPAGTELAFVFSELNQEGGLALSDTYPATRGISEPTAETPASQAGRIFVDIGSGWQQLTSIPTVQRIGIGQTGILLSGIAGASEIIHWRAKGIAAALILASGDTIDQINADRTTGIALIRTYIHEDDGEVQPLAPDEPFTSAQVTALATWLSEHDITPAEFAALFDVTAPQVADWLTSHPRYQFAQQMYERFA